MICIIMYYPSYPTGTFRKRPHGSADFYFILALHLFGCCGIIPSMREFNFFVDAYGLIQTSPSLRGDVTYVLKGRDFSVWEQRRDTHIVYYVVEEDGHRARVVERGHSGDLARILCRLKVKDGIFDVETASLALGKMWRSGMRDIVRELTPDGVVDDAIALTSRTIPIEEAIEIALAIRVEG